VTALILSAQAYALSNSLLVPIPGTLAYMGPWKDSYNFHLSQLRINIECAFGMLTRRWGIFWRRLECRFDKVAHVILCCMKLHNLCIDFRVGDFDFFPNEKGPFFTLSTTYVIGAGRQGKPPRYDRDGRPVDLLTEDAPPPSGKTDTQDRLVARLKAKGLIRPTRLTR